MQAAGSGSGSRVHQRKCRKEGPYLFILAIMKEIENSILLYRYSYGQYIYLYIIKRLNV